jgi:subtilisin family serine protease
MKTQPEDLSHLRSLMALSAGLADIFVAMIDGPVALDHPDLDASRVRVLPGSLGSGGRTTDSAACRHGSLVAGVLHAKRASTVPGICPGCTLLVRSVYADAQSGAPDSGPPTATSAAVATAILEVIDAGARIVNLSLGPGQFDPGGDQAISQVLDAAARRGVLVVAASGNQGVLGSSAITQHPWVIPVAACDAQGRLLDSSNLGASLGRRGLAAPGHHIESLAASGGTARFSGTSAATPFVTGTLALLWAVFPTATAEGLRRAVLGNSPRRSVVPPLLDASAAYRALAVAHGPVAKSNEKAMIEETEHVVAG